MIHVGFTGTQRGLEEPQLAALDRLLGDLAYQHGSIELHHGDCVGADEVAHDLADNSCFDITIHPPDDDSKRAFCTGGISRDPKPYLERNRDIVDESRILIACPNGAERMRSGTWSTIRYARTKIYDELGNQLIYIITPFGEIKTEGR